MATQDSIDKIINIRFNYKELVQGWVKANEAIEDNKKILADLKKEYETGQISLSDYKKAQLELKSTTKALTDAVSSSTIFSKAWLVIKPS